MNDISLSIILMAIKKIVSKTSTAFTENLIGFFKKIYILITLLPIYIAFAVSGFIITSLYDAYIFPEFLFLQDIPSDLILLLSQGIVILAILGSSVFIFSTTILYMINTLNQYIGIFDTTGLNANLIGFLNASVMIFSNTLSTKVGAIKNGLAIYFNNKNLETSSTATAKQEKPHTQTIKIDIDEDTIQKFKQL